MTTTSCSSLAAYARPHVYEQVRSVVPVAAYLLLFQLAVLQRGLPAEWFGMARAAGLQPPTPVA